MFEYSSIFYVVSIDQLLLKNTQWNFENFIMKIYSRNRGSRTIEVTF